MMWCPSVYVGVITYPCPNFNHSGTEVGMFWENKVNTTAADVLFPCATSNID